MPEYTSQHLFNAGSWKELPPSPRAYYGFDDIMYQIFGKWPPGAEKKESLFRFYKNLITTCMWTPLHFFEYLRNGDLRKVLNENGFDWVILSTEAF